MRIKKNHQLEDIVLINSQILRAEFKKIRDKNYHFNLGTKVVDLETELKY